MNILHVVVSLDPAQGGLPAVALRLAAAQAAAGHEVTLTCHDAPAQKDAIDRSLKGIPGIDRVHLSPVPAALTLKTIVPRATSGLLGLHVQHAEVVHLHGVWDPINHHVSVLARKFNRPYVLTPHGMLDPWCLRQRWLKKRLAMWLAYRAMLDGAACLHALNRDEADLMRPLRIRPRVEVLPNGVFLEELEPLPEPGSFRQRHPELGSDPYVLFLSRLHFKKGLDFLASSFALLLKRIPSARLVVAGPDGGEQANFEREVERLGISRRVHVIGPIWGREKFAAMIDADVFCLPSRQEGFSMAVTEALACGLPAVISRECHFPEVEEVGAGVVTPLSAEAVAEGLTHVLADRERRHAMGVAGRGLVRSRFTWPVIADRLLQIYQEVVSHSHGQTARFDNGKERK